MVGRVDQTPIADKNRSSPHSRSARGGVAVPFGLFFDPLGVSSSEVREGAIADVEGSMASGL